MRKPLGAARIKTNNKLNSQYSVPLPGIKPGHIGGRRMQSPLRHPCSHQKLVDYLYIKQDFSAKHSPHPTLQAVECS